MAKLNGFVYLQLILLTLLINVNAYAVSIHVPKDELTIQSGIDAAVDG